MCGRLACSLDVSGLSCAASCKPENSNIFFKAVCHESTKEINPSFNVPPTSVVPVLVSPEQKLFTDWFPAERLLVSMRFGIVPTWMKAQDWKSDTLQTHLCKLERCRESKLYNPLFEKGQRCAIPCTGYFEWQSTKSIGRQPYFFYDKNNDPAALTCTKGSYNTEEGWKGLNLLYLAGIYNCYTDNQGKTCYSFAIITKEADEEWNWVHHRIPVVLQTDTDVNMWIKSETFPLTVSFEILQKSITTLAAHPVNRSVVNNARNNLSKCVEAFDLNPPSSKIMKAWLENSPKKNTQANNSQDQNPEPVKGAPMSIKKWLQNTTTSNDKDKNSQKRTVLDNWLMPIQKKAKFE